MGALLVSSPRKLATGRKALIAQAYRPFLLWDSNLISEGRQPGLCLKQCSRAIFSFSVHELHQLRNALLARSLYERI